MPSKRARKAVSTTLIESIEPSEAIPSLEITLGEEALPQDIDELATLTLLPRAAESSYPEPLSPTQPTQPTQEESETEDDKDTDRLVWSEEMLEQLVEELYNVFIKGGGADNSFKKSTFQSAAKK